MQSNNRDCPVAGEVWKHYKGDLYAILATGIHTETGEYFVVYRLAGAHPEVHAWCRPLAMFMGAAKESPKAPWRFQKANTRSLPSKEAKRVSEGVA